MENDLDPLNLMPKPTPNWPLLGLTILIVEDSRYSCEAMRFMALRSGARLRRADSIQSAKRHLRVYMPSAIIVDVGLPDGSGLDLIRELSSARPRVPALDLTAQGPDALNCEGFLFVVRLVRCCRFTIQKDIEIGLFFECNVKMVAHTNWYHHSDLIKVELILWDDPQI